MRTFPPRRLGDDALLRELERLVAEERSAISVVVAHIAEADARKLFRGAGYGSMYEFCIHALHLSEQAALKRIRAGRVSRKYPQILEALADGRLHLSAVVLLSHHLTPQNVADLIVAATHRTKAQVEQMLAARFPKADVPERVEAIVPPLMLASDLLRPETVDDSRPVPSPDPASAVLAQSSEQLSPGRVVTELRPAALQDPSLAVLAPLPGDEKPAYPRATPLASERFALQVTIGRETHEKLRYAQTLMRHGLPSGDLASVIDRALDALVCRLEKQKFAATTKPRPGSPSTDPRHIPASVKRAVWERDQGRCAFVSANGKRCESCDQLEYDHVEPVARGGIATLEGLRLLCRAHNQYEAERVFGAGFMAGKREAAMARHSARG